LQKMDTEGVTPKSTWSLKTENLIARFFENLI